MGIQFVEVITAMVTPFDAEETIDYAATEQLVEHLIQNRTYSIVVAGTTGERPTLTSEEKVALFNHVVQYVDGRVPVIGGTGSNNTREAIELTIRSEQTGLDG